MEIKYNVTGAKRKELVSLIANFTGCDAKYKGAPTFAYEVDYFTIDKNGTLSFDDRADSEVIERLLEMLYDNSFVAEEMISDEEPEEAQTSEETAEETENHELNIRIPLTAITETAELGTVLSNLEAIIASKHELFKKAIGTDRELTVTADEEQNLCFDWFTITPDTEQAQIYATFVSALCKMAGAAKRVTAKEKPIDNEKFAMRTFLNRIGLSGAEHKPLRKKLMKNLTGNSAFRYGTSENN